MANIRVDLDYTLHDGADVAFNAPCDCTEVTGLIIYYPQLDGTTTSKIFTFRDAHKNDIGSLTELFVSGARVKVNVDIANGCVYVQNADTNAYLEDRINRARPYNLLDNSDFTNPVNQRGQTSYTAAGYTIDRWTLTNQYSKAEMVNGGMKFSCSTGGSYAYPRQLIDGSKLGGKVFTGAVCIEDGSIHLCTGAFPSDEVTTDTTFTSVSFGDYLLTLSKMKNAGELCFQLRVPVNKELIVRWVALYEGEYTLDTLPAYQPKGYHAELMECYRYFYKVAYNTALHGYINTTPYAFIFLPVEMRIKPSWYMRNETGTNHYIYCNGTRYTNPTVNSIVMNGNMVRITLTKPEGLSEKTDFVWVSTEYGFELSADL